MYHCHYANSGPHSKKFSSVQEYKICTNSQTRQEFLFQRVISFLWEMVILWCAYVKCSRRFTIKYFCLLFVGDGVKRQLDQSFVNICGWKGIRDKAEKVNSRKAYMRSGGTSCWVLSGGYISITKELGSFREDCDSDLGFTLVSNYLACIYEESFSFSQEQVKLTYRILKILFKGISVGYKWNKNEPRVKYIKLFH
jgi:hypothetical protein